VEYESLKAVIEGHSTVIKNCGGWHWWLTPVILTTWEAEIRRIKIQGQPGQQKQDYLKNTQHIKGLVE
jgi:hypothetical protein